jgi:hypothetical protein
MMHTQADAVQPVNENQMQNEVLSFCGSWAGISAGGSFEYASWRYNPQLFVKSQKPCSLKIVLSQERDAVRLVASVLRAPSLTFPPPRRTSSRLACTWLGQTARGIA